MNHVECESVVSTDHSSAQVTVRLGAIAANYREIKKRAASALVAPVVKADAYHVGMVPVAQTLAAEGADSFFVARIEEGIALRALLPNGRIFVFDGVAPGTAPSLIAHRLIPVLNCLDDIAEWSRAGFERRTSLDAALQVDTGMNRSGLPFAELGQLTSNAQAYLSGINLVHIMSHLACAEEPANPKNKQQLERFRAALAVLPSAPASLAATAGIELGRDYLFDMVRPGIALYGGKPVRGRPNPYRMALRVTSRVLQIRKLETGETAGYGATFTAVRPTTAAIVAIGYADSVIRATSGSGRAAIAGMRVPYAGRISMDLLALDVTDAPETAVERGTEVEFLGETITLEDAAEAAHTNEHEVLTSISARVRRIYLGD